MKRLVMMLSAGTVALMLSSGAWASGAEHVDSAQIAAAKTPADHEAIAKSYDAEAVAADAKATAHESMAKTYRPAVRRRARLIRRWPGIARSW